MPKKKKEVAPAGDLEDFIKSMSKTLRTKDEEKVDSFISTGSTLLDYAIANRRNGGIPIARLTEIAGEESSGKTLIATHVLANTQKMGGIAVYIDTEHSAQKEFMQRIGVDWDMLLKPKPTTIEETFDTIEQIVIHAREKFDISKPLTIVWDSIAATPPRAEIEGDYDPNSLMGVPAKTMSKGMRKLVEMIDYGKVTLLFLNQLRYRLNLENKYADPWITPYGKAVPFHASVRVRLNSFTKVKDEKDEKTIIGVWCRAHIKKSKISPPERKIEFPIMFDRGVDDAASIYKYLHEECGLIEKSAGNSKLFLGGAEKVFPHSEWRNFFKQNKQAIDSLLEQRIVAKYEPYDDDSDSEEESSGENETA